MYGAFESELLQFSVYANAVQSPRPGIFAAFRESSRFLRKTHGSALLAGLACLPFARRAAWPARLHGPLACAAPAWPAWLARLRRARPLPRLARPPSAKLEAAKLRSLGKGGVFDTAE